MLPDELGTAYFEHVASGNTLTTEELFSRVRKAKSRLQRPSKAHLIAEIAGLSDQDFVCSHTCKPFYGAFECTSRWCHPHGANERGSPNNPMLNHRRFGYYLCPQCASEDLEFWGRSYWRRSHQIVGVSWCSKHEIPLNVVTGEVLSSQPHKAIDASCECTSTPFPSENTIPRRYQKLVSTLLAFQGPAFLPHLIRILQQQLNRKNYACWTTAHGKRFVSDTILATCPNQWCHDLFPDFQTKGAGKYFRDIDAIELGRDDQAVTYVLALAVLYGDPDEAASLISLLSGAPSRYQSQPSDQDAVKMSTLTADN